MDDGKKLAKSTGSTPSTEPESANASAPVESTGRKKESPVSSTVPTKEESLNSTVTVSASKLLAIQIMLGDFKGLKSEMPSSWQASKNGKIYWCAEMPGHLLAIQAGNLLVDGKPVHEWLEKLLDG